VLLQQLVLLLVLLGVGVVVLLVLIPMKRVDRKQQLVEQCVVEQCVVEHGPALGAWMWMWVGTMRGGYTT
jgi:hypothetical protein